MAKGLEASDWTVEHTGDEGTIRSAEYRGRFKVRRSGIVQIVWQDGPGPKDASQIERAAQEAIEAAIRPRA
jgi:hypothetical protein